MSGPVPDPFTLGVTTLSLVDAAPGLTDRLLLTESTNVHNLAHDPLRVLGASAFWVGGTRLPWKVGVRFLLVTAPAERWLGTGRWLLAFAAGHVGATLVTVSGIAYGIHAGWLGQGLATVSDVGVSYGFFAVAAVLTYRIPRPWRWVWAGTLIGYLSVTAAVEATFTEYGHLCAIGIGFGLYPLTRAPERRRLARADGASSGHPAGKEQRQTSQVTSVSPEAPARPRPCDATPR